MNARIKIPKDAVAKFCQRNRICRLALFGSVLRDDFAPDSDVDVLVEFQPDARVGGWRLSQLGKNCQRYWAGKWICIPSGESKATGTGCSGRRYSVRRRRCMTKRDDQVSLVDMLIYAEEAIDMLGDASLDAPW